MRGIGNAEERGLRILKRVVTWTSLRKRLIRDMKEVIRERRTCGGRVFQEEDTAQAGRAQGARG